MNFDKQIREPKSTIDKARGSLCSIQLFCITHFFFHFYWGHADVSLCHSWYDSTLKQTQTHVSADLHKEMCHKSLQRSRSTISKTKVLALKAGVYDFWRYSKSLSSFWQCLRPKSIIYMLLTQKKLLRTGLWTQRTETEAKAKADDSSPAFIVKLLWMRQVKAGGAGQMSEESWAGAYAGWNQGWGKHRDSG